jgi:hypothetical protein
MTLTNPIETSPVRLECDGLSTRDFSAPPFRVEAGQSVCFHIRLLSPLWHEKVLPLLSGRIAHPALHLYGSVSYLERPMPRRRWWGGLRNPSAWDWLTAERGLTSPEAAAVLDLVDEPADLSIGRIGWNERTMLALEACLLRPPDLLVFDTCGNDLLTALHLFERLTSRPPQLAMVYLKTRFESDDPCLPDAACVELVPSPSQTVLVE